ncbi:MAG: nuclear transport factor 2 family protein [Novosphingobium sp.]|nr:nuclear transport factor 2 family protein [Novosphingobium sp.]
MTLTDADLREENFALYRRMTEALNARDIEGCCACIAEDIVFEAPAYREPGVPVAAGAAAMRDMYRGLMESFKTIDYTIERFIPALDPDLVIVEVAGNNLVAATGKYYRNRYLFLVGCRQGKIAHILEYSNPQIFREAHAAA